MAGSQREVARRCPKPECKAHFVTGETERERKYCHDCGTESEPLTGLPSGRPANLNTERQ